MSELVYMSEYKAAIARVTDLEQAVERAETALRAVERRCAEAEAALREAKLATEIAKSDRNRIGMDMRKEFVPKLMVLDERARAAEAREAKLRAALTLFGVHQLACDSMDFGSSNACDCGLDAALALNETRKP